MARDGDDRPDRPFPPALFDDEPPPEPPSGVIADDAPGDAPLLRVAGAIVVLAVVLIVLVLPPISILDRGSSASTNGSGISTTARDELPPLPAGLAARSALYDISVPETLAGPVTMTVRLREAAVNRQSLALYAYDDGQWLRLGSAEALESGVAEGVVEHIPSTIAVLERIALAHELGFIVEPGQAPDPLAGPDGVVAVPAAQPALDAEGAPTVLEVDAGALASALASGHPVYLGIEAGPDPGVIDTILSDGPLTELHANRIADAARAQGVAGVYLDYREVDPALRAAFSGFAESVAEALAPAPIALAIAVPAPIEGGEDAYDWNVLSTVGVLWLHGPPNPDDYYARLEAALESARGAAIDLERVWLVADRRSTLESAAGVERITLREALTQASALRTRLDVAIAPGDGVTLEAANLGAEGGAQYGWNDRARAPSFAYEARGGERSVWIENRFSLAFRLDLARRFRLGGVVIAAAAGEQLPDVWNTVSAFAEEGSVRLELPYGPYLAPEWRTSEGAIEGDGTLVVWRAPATPGIYDVSLVVSDGVVFVGQQLSLRVTADGAPAEPTPTESAEVTPTPAGN